MTLIFNKKSCGSIFSDTTDDDPIPPAPGPGPLPEPVPEPVPVCRELTTQLNDDGSGNALYLDRHDVRCASNEIMKSFRLARGGGNKKYQYIFTCCKKTVTCTKQFMNNGYSDDGSGSLVYLDRQNIGCPNNGFLGQFKMNRKSGGGKYRYSYECCLAAGRKDVKKFSTAFNSDGGHNGNGKDGNTVYLDRHNIKCPDLYSLSQWKIKRDATKNKIRFDFTCVKSILAPGKGSHLIH